MSEETLVEVEHVKAHRSKKVKKDMSQFEKFATGGNEKADELAKAGSILDEGFLAETRARRVQQERDVVCAALQYAPSFHCLVEEWEDCEELKPKSKEKWIFVVEKKEEMKYRMELCVGVNKYRCMRCGIGSKYMKMPRKCAGRPKYLSTFLGKMETATLATIW